MAFVNFKLRALILFAEAILNGQIMQIVQGLKQLQILNIRINPIKSLSGGSQCFFNVIYRCKNPCVYQPDFHLIHSS
ncbi:hypothetical protein D3C75_943560 [compost metagenome]